MVRGLLTIVPQAMDTAHGPRRKNACKTCVLSFYYVKMHTKSAPKERRTKWCEDCAQFHPKETLNQAPFLSFYYVKNVCKVRFSMAGTRNDPQRNTKWLPRVPKRVKRVIFSIFAKTA